MHVGMSIWSPCFTVRTDSAVPNPPSHRCRRTCTSVTPLGRGGYPTFGCTTRYSFKSQGSGRDAQINPCVIVHCSMLP